MFDSILNASYEEARQRFSKFLFVDTLQRRISVKGDGISDSLSKDSDIIIYYSLVGDNKPLLIL